jgi:hypothetical protein
MTNHLLSHGGRVSVRRVLLACGAVAAFAACGTDTSANDPLVPQGTTGRMRFINLINDTTRGRVDLSVDNLGRAGTWNANQVYGQVTPVTTPNPALYTAALTGIRSVSLRRTADPNTLVATLPVTVVENADHSLYAIGGAGASAITGFVTRDTNVVPTAGQARVRVVHLSPTAGAVDIFVTAVGADLALATPTLANVPYQGVSAYLSVAAGTYQVRVVPAGTAPAARAAAVALNVASLALGAQVNRTIVAADRNLGGTPLQAFVLTDR